MTDIKKDESLVEEQGVSAEELMKKFDKDSKSRNFTGIYKIIYSALMIAFSVFITLPRRGNIA